MPGSKHRGAPVIEAVAVGDAGRLMLALVEARRPPAALPRHPLVSHIRFLFFHTSKTCLVLLVHPEGATSTPMEISLAEEVFAALTVPMSQAAIAGPLLSSQEDWLIEFPESE